MAEPGLEDAFEGILKRRRELEAALGDPALNHDRRGQIAREHAQLQPIAEKIDEYASLATERSGLDEILADPDTDPALRALAEEDHARIQASIDTCGKDIRELLVPADEANMRDVILEVRAGTGGDEAALFARDLFRMYERYAEAHSWKFRILSLSENALGGAREAMAEVVGRGAYGRLRHESGVHRVQRVPTTEASGRIHTSAATVAVLPKAEDVDRGHRARRPPDRHLPRPGCGRPACQQDRQCSPDHASSDQYGRGVPGREVAAPEPGKGDERPAGPPL